MLSNTYHIGFKSAFDYKRLSNKVKIIDNKIYYNKSVANDIFDMYYTRYKFHREIYNHKAVKAIELMIGDILINANDMFNYPAILNTPEFLNLDDSILTRIKYSNEPCANFCQQLLNRIETRQIYKEIYNTNNSTIEEVKDNILDKYQDNKESDFHFVEMNFNFCNDNKSPFSKIHFYENGNEPILHDSISIRKLVPNAYNESIISVYNKNI